MSHTGTAGPAVPAGFREAVTAPRLLLILTENWTGRRTLT